MTTKVIIKQYNLLSQKLCDGEWFPMCNPDAVDPEKRYLRICTKILKAINEGAILCLQEISQSWLTRLIGVFESKNYVFVYRLYGTKFTDYMGVGIAFPREKYMLMNSRIVRVGDYIPCPPKKDDSRSDSESDSTVSSRSWWDVLDYYGIISMVGRGWRRFISGAYQRPPVDQWDVARKKYNMMVMVSLLNVDSKNDGDAFTVATYHMPCSFRQPTVMALHSFWAIRTAQLWTESVNSAGVNGRLIFAADMNIKPESEEYNMITRGRMVKRMQTPEEGGLTAVNNWGSWEPIWGHMNSMYPQNNGFEPKFTNYARTARSETDFIATLDYVFISRDWKVIECTLLPEEEAEEHYPTPLPTIDEPSDHLMIGGVIEIADIA